MPAEVHPYPELAGRSMLVKKCSVIPVEAIVRGYITGMAIIEVAECRIWMERVQVEGNRSWD
jgi:phosphoribosylaminoimidazole-succinocarboxamide synthase